jgi:predicted TIM-barrel fold metal-dependent hydrolase
MGVSPFKFGIYDADNHYSESSDAYTRHLDAAYRDRALHIERRDVNDSPSVWFGTEPLHAMPVLNVKTGRPGSVARNKDERYKPLPESEMVVLGSIPEAVDKEARLSWMDTQGVDAALLWPGLGLTVEHQMRDDPEACVANLRAFNRWLDEDWGFAHKGRLFAVPCLTLLDLGAAIAELDYVLARGARVVSLLFVPVNGRSLAHPDFDPFWARIQEADVPVGFHGSLSGYNEMFSVQWGEKARPPYNAQSAFQRACFFGERPIMDTLASLVLHNLFGRFPEVQILSIENGSAWVDYLLRVMDKGAISGYYGEWMGGRIDDEPSEIFKRHVYVAPFDDDDIRRLVDLIGFERVLLGSDYPHPEGLENPSEFLTGAGLSESEALMVGRENLRHVLKV